MAYQPPERQPCSISKGPHVTPSQTHSQAFTSTTFLTCAWATAQRSQGLGTGLVEALEISPLLVSLTLAPTEMPHRQG